MITLTDKVAVVTGAASGIGRATAVAFAREGASVAIVDVDKKLGEEAAAEIRDQGGEALVYPTDIADDAAVKKLINDVFDHRNHLDILVNNAGIYYQGDVSNTSLETWNKVMGVNLTGAFLCTKWHRVHPGLKSGAIGLHPVG